MRRMVGMRPTVRLLRRVGLHTDHTTHYGSTAVPPRAHLQYDVCVGLQLRRRGRHVLQQHQGAPRRRRRRRLAAEQLRRQEANLRGHVGGQRRRRVRRRQRRRHRRQRRRQHRHRGAAALEARADGSGDGGHVGGSVVLRSHRHHLLQRRACARSQTHVCAMSTRPGKRLQGLSMHHHHAGYHASTSHSSHPPASPVPCPCPDGRHARATHPAWH